MARQSVSSVEGLRELRKTLKAAGVDIRELKPVNREAAEIAMDRAIQEAPEDSGKLKATLRVGATNQAGIIRAGNNRKAGVPYAGPIHWGWPGRGIEANPFMAKAARVTENRWQQLYERFTEKVISKVRGK